MAPRSPLVTGRPPAPPLRPARVRVPASTSNLGAGFDCLGLALDRYLRAEWTPAPPGAESGAEGVIVEAAGESADLEGEDRLLEAFRGVFGERGIEPRGRLSVRSDVPVSKGLGSSAAATVAGLVLAHRALGEPLDPASLLAAATRREGHPDNALAALHGGLVAAAPARGGVRAVPLPLSPAVGIAFAAPAAGVSTDEARTVLPSTVPHGEAVAALSRLVALMKGLETADPGLIEAGLDDTLHAPYRLALIPGGEAAVRAGVEAGAWGVTVSGSGSGLLALCPPDRADHVRGAMAAALADAAGGTLVDAAAAADEGSGPGRAVDFVARPEPRGALTAVDPLPPT